MRGSASGWATVAVVAFFGVYTWCLWELSASVIRGPGGIQRMFLLAMIFGWALVLLGLALLLVILPWHRRLLIPLTGEAYDSARAIVASGLALLVIGFLASFGELLFVR